MIRERCLLYSLESPLSKLRSSYIDDLGHLFSRWQRERESILMNSKVGVESLSGNPCVVLTVFARVQFGSSPVVVIFKHELDVDP